MLFEMILNGFLRICEGGFFPILLQILFRRFPAGRTSSSSSYDLSLISFENLLIGKRVQLFLFIKVLNLSIFIENVLRAQFAGVVRAPISLVVSFIIVLV